MSTKNENKEIQRLEKEAKRALRKNTRDIQHKRYQTKQLRLEVVTYAALKQKAVREHRPLSKMADELLRPVLGEYIRSAKEEFSEQKNLNGKI